MTTISEISSRSNHEPNQNFLCHTHPQGLPCAPAWRTRRFRLTFRAPRSLPEIRLYLLGSGTIQFAGFAVVTHFSSHK